MRNATICLAVMVLLSGAVDAKGLRSMMGTVTRTVQGGRWSGLIIRVGSKEYGVQTTYEPSAGDESRGEKPSQLTTVGNCGEGSRVRVFFTNIDCSHAYEEGIPCWVTATKIVEIVPHSRK